MLQTITQTMYVADATRYVADATRYVADDTRYVADDYSDDVCCRRLLRRCMLQTTHGMLQTTHGMLQTITQTAIIAPRVGR